MAGWMDGFLRLQQLGINAVKLGTKKQSKSAKTQYLLTTNPDIYVKSKLNPEIIKLVLRRKSKETKQKII